jgi:hypothetical protein
VSLVKPRADMAAQLITDLETRIAELDRDRERLSTLQKQLQSEIASGLSRQEIASTQVYASNVQSRVKDVLAEVTRVLDDLD